MSDVTASEPLREWTIVSKSTPRLLSSKWVRSSSGSLLNEESVCAPDLRKLTRNCRVSLGLSWPMLNAAGPPEPTRCRRPVVSHRQLPSPGAIRGRESSFRTRARIAPMGARDGVPLGVESFGR
jgi:hypothetical protein